MGNDAGSLEQLLARSWAGDRAAFEAFYDQTAVRAFSLAQLVAPERPEELLERSYAEAWRTAGEGRPVSPLAWLLAIVRDTARGPTAPSPTG